MEQVTRTGQTGTNDDPSARFHFLRPSGRKPLKAVISIPRHIETRLNGHTGAYRNLDKFRTKSLLLEPSTYTRSWDHTYGLHVHFGSHTNKTR